jgi:tetratricopeptide (TPR) repeat protein
MKNFAYLSRAAVVAIVLALLLPLGALGGYTEGMDCFKNKDWDCVVAQFMTEVQAHPDYDFGWFMMGIAQLQKKEYDKAVENFNKAIEINGDKLGYHVNKAKAYTDQKQYDKVIATLTGKDSLEGAQGEVFSLNYQLGTAYHQKAKHGEAIPYLEKSAAVKPDFTTLYMLGVSYDALGNTDKSISSLKEALAQQPGNADVQAILGSTYLELAQKENAKPKKTQYYADALKYAQGAAKAKPGDHVKQNLVARAYLGAGQFDQAEASFKKVLELDPNYCFARLNLGKVYIAKKEWTKGVTVLQEATKCLPKNDVAWESLGFCQEKLYKDMSTDEAKMKQLNLALNSFQTAAKFTNRSSVQGSIDRVKQNIEIAGQNQAIALRNIQTMEANLDALRKTKVDTLAALKKIEDTRQFFLDKGQWPDEKEQEFQREKSDIEKAVADLDNRIADQENELAQARAALNRA